jgi:hypothetical protein
MEQLSYFYSGEYQQYRAECRRMARLARQVEPKQHPPKAQELLEQMRLFGQRHAGFLNWNLGRTPSYS